MTQEVGCPARRHRVPWTGPSCCDDYVRLMGDTLVPVEPGFVAGDNSFELRWDKAPPIASWTWPWSDRCAVRGGVAERSVGQVWNPADRYGLPGGMRVEIPACAQHELGVRVMYPFLHFRAYDHWRAFRAANGLDRRKGPED